MKNVACYLRVSTAEQKNFGLSIDAQEKALKEYCIEHDYRIVGFYNDAGISAHISYKKRPNLQRMIEDCQKGKIELVLFTKLDRFFRNVPDYYACMERMNDIPWRAIWEDYETETSAGKFKVNIMLSIAQAESDRTSERIKSTFEYKRAMGDYVGHAPFGYMRQNNKLVKNPEEAPFVELAYKTYFATHSSSSARRKLLEAGKQISRNGMNKLLSSNTYRGDAYGFKCEPYLTEEECIRLDQIRASNYRSPKGYSTIYLFPRICVCSECGNIMRSLSKEGKFNTYACNYQTSTNHIGKSLNVSEKKLEKYLLEKLDDILAEYNIQSETSAKNDKLADSKKKKAQLEAKLERIGIRFEEGEISVDEYKEKRKAIHAEIASLDFSQTAQKVELPNNWKEIYADLDKSHKQAFWLSIIKEINVSRDYNIKITFL